MNEQRMVAILKKIVSEDIFDDMGCCPFHQRCKGGTHVAECPYAMALQELEAMGCPLVAYQFAGEIKYATSSKWVSFMPTVHSFSEKEAWEKLHEDWKELFENQPTRNFVLVNQEKL